MFPNLTHTEYVHSTYHTYYVQPFIMSNIWFEICITGIESPIDPNDKPRWEAKEKMFSSPTLTDYSCPVANIWFETSQGFGSMVNPNPDPKDGKPQMSSQPDPHWLQPLTALTGLGKSSQCKPEWTCRFIFCTKSAEPLNIKWTFEDGHNWDLKPKQSHHHWFCLGHLGIFHRNPWWMELKWSNMRVQLDRN